MELSRVIEKDYIENKLELIFPNPNILKWHVKLDFGVHILRPINYLFLVYYVSKFYLDVYIRMQESNIHII